MKLLIIGMVFLALSVAGVSTYLIRSFSGEENIEGLQKEAATEKKVLVAAKTIRPGEKVVDGFVRWQGWSKDSLNDKFIVIDNEKDGEKRLKEFVGSIARVLIHQGEPILADKVFKSEKAAFMSGKLDQGMRAVSFSVSPQTASAGFILPGNRIDVLMSHTIKWEKKKKSKKNKEKEESESSQGGQELAAGSETKITETILQDVKVLAINQTVDLVEGNSIAATTVTLEVTPKQAEMLITARSIGKLSMVLRSLRTPKEGDGPLGYTVDTEVSPFIQQFLASKQMVDRKTPVTKQTVVKSQPVEKKSVKRTPIKIFRGAGAGATEEAK
ncbi:MAG: Flp pilus assembly protein CpaB [Rhodospirillales bacterium]|nr:Flp pilus assembly protein CpaB [Rhodospirillales bacterium]